MDADVPWPLGAPAFWISRSSWSIFSTRASQNPKRIDKFRQAPDDFGLVHSVYSRLESSQYDSICLISFIQFHHFWCNIDPDMESWDDDYNDCTCRSKRLRDTVGVPISALTSLPGGLKLSSKSCTVILQTEVKPCFMTRETVPLPWNK